MLSSSRYGWMDLYLDRYLLHRQKEQCRGVRGHQFHVELVCKRCHVLCVPVRCQDGQWLPRTSIRVGRSFLRWFIWVVTKKSISRLVLTLRGSRWDQAGSI